MSLSNCRRSFFSRSYQFIHSQSKYSHKIFMIFIKTVTLWFSSNMTICSRLIDCSSCMNLLKKRWGKKLNSQILLRESSCRTPKQIIRVNIEVTSVALFTGNRIRRITMSVEEYRKEAHELFFVFLHNTFHFFDNISEWVNIWLLYKRRSVVWL